MGGYILSSDLFMIFNKYLLQFLGPRILERGLTTIYFGNNTKSNDPRNNVVQMSDLEKQLHDQKDEIAKLQATDVAQIENKSWSKMKPKFNLCRNYMSGNCQYADKCLYAHGLNDLQNPFYKTKMCKNLPNCKYGDNCINAHSKVVMDQLTILD